MMCQRRASMPLPLPHPVPLDHAIEARPDADLRDVAAGADPDIAGVDPEPIALPGLGCQLADAAHRGLDRGAGVTLQECPLGVGHDGAGMVVFSSTVQGAIPDRVRGRVFTLLDVT